jgi:hypothetical protein
MTPHRILSRDLPLAVTLDVGAELLGCSRPTLEHMVDDPACPVTATRYKGRRFVSVESLRTFLASAQ